MILQLSLIIFCCGRFSKLKNYLDGASSKIAFCSLRAYHLLHVQVFLFWRTAKSVKNSALKSPHLHLYGGSDIMFAVHGMKYTPNKACLEVAVLMFVTLDHDHLCVCFNQN